LGPFNTRMRMVVSFFVTLLLLLYEKNNVCVCQSGALSPMLPLSWNDVL
jgi:hypothetical protein